MLQFPRRLRAAVVVWATVICVPHVRGQKSDFVVDGASRNGEEITCDLPAVEHLKNKVGRDGLGLCVFTSIDHSARWANEPALVGFRDWMTKHQGGGWPEKVDDFIPKFAQARGFAIPAYVQHTGGDEAFLKLALKTHRMPCVTYAGRDGVYYRGPVAHMVNLVHFSDSGRVASVGFPTEALPDPDKEISTIRLF